LEQGKKIENITSVGHQYIYTYAVGHKTSSFVVCCF